MDEGILDYYSLMKKEYVLAFKVQKIPSMF